MIKKDFNVRNGKLYSLLETKDYGEIVFGCPPGIVKDFIKSKKPLPSKYVISSQTFCDNKNNFDFEFIVYSFLFTRAQGSTVFAYCLPAQEKRFRDILNETLFGPRFDQLLADQSNKLLNEKCLNDKGRENLSSLLRKNIARNKSLSILFDNLLREHSSESQVSKHLKQFFEDEILPKNQSMLNSGIKHFAKKLTKIYLQCAQIQKECQLFSLADERNRNNFVSKTVKFQHLEKSGFFLINSLKDKRKKLKLQEIKPNVFRVLEKNKERCTINLNSTISENKKQKNNPFRKPRFGVTFVGVGSGFSQDQQNSSVIVWSEGRGILIDVVYESNSILAEYGINTNDIDHVFLTHVHSDHDAGVLENVLEHRKNAHYNFTYYL